MELLERDEFPSTLDQYLTEVESASERRRWYRPSSGVTAIRTASLSGACEGLFTPRALGPLVDMAAEIGREFVTLLNRHGRRDQVFSALLADLTKKCALHDPRHRNAHWADEATLDLIRYLGRHLAGIKTMLVLHTATTR